MRGCRYHWNLEILQSVAGLAKRIIARTAAWLPLFAAIASATACPAPPEGDAPAPRADRPDVVVVVIDTLRRDHLSAYGYGKPTSPRLAELAKSSVVFERALAASSWTEPSTASLLTGLYPPRHGAHEYARVPASATLLAEVLHAAGWRTGGVSGNPNASPQFGFDQGFDSFDFSGNEEAREYPDVGELVGKARKFLQEAHAKDPAAPRFCYLHVMNVHGPYRAPPEQRERFLEKPFEEFPFQNEIWKAILRKGQVERRKDVTPAKLHDLTARYDGAIAYTDSVIGGFLDELLAGDGGKNTLVVVTADHGEELFDHGGFGHGFTLHREVVDVPLLIRLPGGEGGGTRVAEPVSLVDVAPTLLDRLGLLGAQPDGRFGDGVSLAPLLRGGKIERDAPMVAQLERGKQGKAFLLEQWPLRLILTERDYAGREDVLELFDLEKDPDERHDLLAGDAARAAELRRKLAARRSQLESAALPTTTEELDEATRRKMEALGYGSEKGGGR
jgi:arylsulfatase A-like enzyme